MRRSTLLLLALLVATPPSLRAQGPPELAPGARLRITAPEITFANKVATTVAVRGDSLVVQPVDGDTTAVIAFAQIRKLEVSQGVQRQALRGFGIGLLAGGAFGAVLGFADGDDSQGFVQFSAVEKALLGGLVFGGIGGAVGLAAGSATRSERWTRVPLDRQRVGVTVTPMRSGVALRGTVRF
jgi:hypothetical protein